MIGDWGLEDMRMLSCWKRRVSGLGDPNQLPLSVRFEEGSGQPVSRV